MGKRNLIIRLDAASADARRVLCGQVELSGADEARPITWVTLTRTGTFTDPRYGKFSITPQMLLAMKSNFEAGVYGQDVLLDVAHQPANGAAGKLLELSISGDKLRGRVEWTPHGIDAVRNKGYAYMSVEYTENYVDNETEKKHGPLLMGAGLVVRPAIKHLDRVELAEAGDESGGAHVVHPHLANKLLKEFKMTFAQYLAMLIAMATEKKLGAAVIEVITGAFKTVAESVTDTVQLQAAYDQMVTVVNRAVETGANTLAITLAAPTGLTAEQVKQLMQEESARVLAEAQRGAQALEANIKMLGEAINASALAADVKQKLIDGSKALVTAAMTEPQVKALAAAQVQMVGAIAAQNTLAAMGFERAPRAGTPYIQVDTSNDVKRLQEHADKVLGYVGMPNSQRFATTGGQLLEGNKAFAEKVLAMFDADRGAQLHQEAKMLAAGDGVMSDTAVPATFERTVIRESLYRLTGLSLVDMGTDVFGATHQIPYSYRDTTAAGVSAVRRYEGQAIARAGVKQSMDTAYPIPQKLSFEVSDELRYLTSNGQLNWDAVQENARNAVRIISEDTEALIYNEVLRSNDEFGATAVANEALTQVNGTNKIFALVNFPVVRPRKVYDLQGNQVGSTSNPVAFTYNGNACTEYDGTGTQSAGVYFVLDYNLGEVRFVNQAGVLQTPTNGWTITANSYSYTTNVAKFDTDLGSATVKDKWDTFFFPYGGRKNVIEVDRFYSANMGLMSPTVQNMISQAEQFGGHYTRPGTDLQADGTLGRIKNVPNFFTSAPGLWLGDTRVIIGERSNTRFRMTKPWRMGELQDQKNSDGRFVAKKEAYGDQFIVLHTPAPLKNATTSMVLYSATGRVNRAA